MTDMRSLIDLLKHNAIHDKGRFGTVIPLDVAIDIIRAHQAEQPQDIQDLLRDMRRQVSYTNLAIMPIPLYERIKAAIISMGDSNLFDFEHEKMRIDNLMSNKPENISTSEKCVKEVSETLIGKLDAEKLSDVVGEYLHWRKVNQHIKGGDNYLKRLHDALTAANQPCEISVDEVGIHDAVFMAVEKEISIHKGISRTALAAYIVNAIRPYLTLPAREAQSEIRVTADVFYNDIWNIISEACLSDGKGNFDIDLDKAVRGVINYKKLPAREIRVTKESQIVQARNIKAILDGSAPLGAKFTLTIEKAETGGFFAKSEDMIGLLTYQPYQNLGKFMKHTASALECLVNVVLSDSKGEKS